jgi:protein-L-isoaspartate(D-aspartate) O-methyltransferase
LIRARRSSCGSRFCKVPNTRSDQLGEGGTMVPLGPHDDAQVIVRLTKTKHGLAREDLIGVRFVPLLPGIARIVTALAVID